MQPPPDLLDKRGPLYAEPPGAVDIWSVPGFAGIQLHRGRKVTQSYPRHWHDEWYFAAVLDGSGTLEFSGSSLITPRKTLIAIPPGDVHANDKTQCTFRCMFVDTHAIESMVENFYGQKTSSIHTRGGLIDHPQTLVDFVSLHRLLESSDHTLHSDLAASEFFAGLVTRHSDTGLSAPCARGQEDRAMLRAQEFLNEHYAERVTLRELSRYTGLSPFHLNRAFSRKFGIPPHAYQVQIRISRAKSLLRSGRAISEAALCTGFVDQSHFSRQFKKFVGITPGQYIR